MTSGTTGAGSPGRILSVSRDRAADNFSSSLASDALFSAWTAVSNSRLNCSGSKGMGALVVALAGAGPLISSLSRRLVRPLTDEISSVILSPWPFFTLSKSVLRPSMTASNFSSLEACRPKRSLTSWACSLIASRATMILSTRVDTDSGACSGWVCCTSSDSVGAGCCCGRGVGSGGLTGAGDPGWGDPSPSTVGLVAGFCLGGGGGGAGGVEVGVLLGTPDPMMLLRGRPLGAVLWAGMPSPRTGTLRVWPTWVWASARMARSFALIELS
jgi:hypothetical protein